MMERVRVVLRRKRLMVKKSKGSFCTRILITGCIYVYILSYMLLPYIYVH